MSDVVLGLLAILVGAPAFCFQGYLALRLIIPIWGAQLASPSAPASSP